MGYSEQQVYYAENKTTGEFAKGTAYELAGKLGVDKRTIYVSGSMGRPLRSGWEIIKSEEKVPTERRDEKSCACVGTNFAEAWDSAVAPFKKVIWVSSGGKKLIISGYKRKPQ